MYARIKTSFFRWGWLVPCFLPLTQVLGRAVFTLCAIFFLTIAAPPDNLLIGVGMGNARRNKAMMRMEIGRQKRVKGG